MNPSAPTKSSEALRLRSLGLSNKQGAAVLGVPVDSFRRLVSTAPRTPSLPPEWGEVRGGGFETVPERHVHVETPLSFRQRGVSYKKPTHLIIPDTQVRPGVPTDHLLWAGKYIAERQPDVVVHLGDHWDLPSLSSYEGKGSKWFEGKRLKADIAAGNDALDLLMEGMGSFRPKRMVLLRGNHEDRLTRAINETPTLLEGLVGFEDFNDVTHGWEVIPYLKPIDIDGLAYAHYFYNPNTGRAYSGNPDTMLRNIGHSFVMGHQQGLRIGRRELASGHTQRGLVAGSFYQHSEEYRGPQAAFEWRGLVVLHEVGGGTYDLMEVGMDYLRRTFS